MPSTLFCAGILLLLLAPVVQMDSQNDSFEDDLMSYYAPSSSSSMDRYNTGSSSSHLGHGDPSKTFLPQVGQSRNELDTLFSSNGRLGESSNAQRSALTGTNFVSRENYRDDEDDGRVRGNEEEREELLENDKRSSLGKRLKFLNQNVREHYMKMFAPSKVNALGTKELKRERHGGTTLSVESPMDLIRQRLLQELRRREMQQKQRQIQSNDELLSSIGKRSFRRSSSPLLDH